MFKKENRSFGRSEQSEYIEDRMHRQYVGGSRGVSVRVMKGVYYHVGGFKGHAIDRTERIHVDTGLVVATSKHIYFAGPKKAFRVPYIKIVSFHVRRDKATLSSGCKAHPAIRSSRKQPEQAWRRRSV